MKHLELHILQSFPVACLNRDDLNSPKTAVFGGVQRARFSSQCWKRSTRELARELLPERFKGERSRYIVNPLIHAFKVLGKSEDEAKKMAQEFAAELATKDTDVKTKTLFYATPGELKEFAKIYVNSKSPQAAKKAITKLIMKTPNDAADIALFGRMVAADYTGNLEGAAMFSHALSTHKADNEIDFFSAVDDLQPKEEPGAGMTGTLEFNSATYYRFAALNLDMLRDEDHLEVLSVGERKEIVRTFTEAAVLAVPGARRNSMNAATRPGYVLGIVRENGHPVQLVNAFEKPIRPNGKGVFESSLEAMKTEHEQLNSTWGLKKREIASVAIPDVTLEDFLEELTQHVN